jgi:hypothetical protein
MKAPIFSLLLKLDSDFDMTASEGTDEDLDILTLDADAITAIKEQYKAQLKQKVGKPDAVQPGTEQPKPASG